MNNSQFIYLSLTVLIITLFITFIYYEFYYLKKVNNKDKIILNSDVIILLDKKNNRGSPYHFKQEWGTDNYGSIILNKDQFEIPHNDRYITYPRNEKSCSTQYNNISISMDIKLPYIYSNKGWNKTYQSYKPIIKFGNSPVISYNPYNHQIILSILYKDNPNVVRVQNIYFNDVFIEKWMNIIFVIENRKVKIYLNKKLVKYDILDGVPMLQLSDNHLVKMGEYKNNLNGYINNITLYMKALTTQEINKL